MTLIRNQRLVWIIIKDMVNNKDLPTRNLGHIKSLGGLRIIIHMSNINKGHTRSRGGHTQSAGHTRSLGRTILGITTGMQNQCPTGMRGMGNLRRQIGLNGRGSHQYLDVSRIGIMREGQYNLCGQIQHRHLGIDFHHHHHHRHLLIDFRV